MRWTTDISYLTNDTKYIMYLVNAWEARIVIYFVRGPDVETEGRKACTSRPIIT